MLGAEAALILIFGSVLTYPAWTEFGRNCCTYKGWLKCTLYIQT